MLARRRGPSHEIYLRNHIERGITDAGIVCTWFRVCYPTPNPTHTITGDAAWGGTDLAGIFGEGAAYFGIVGFINGDVEFPVAVIGFADANVSGFGGGGFGGGKIVCVGDVLLAKKPPIFVPPTDVAPDPANLDNMPNPARQFMPLRGAKLPPDNMPSIPHPPIDPLRPNDPTDPNHRPSESTRR